MWTTNKVVWYMWYGQVHFETREDFEKRVPQPRWVWWVRRMLERYAVWRYQRALKRTQQEVIGI
jgi:hypothetical protein